MTYQEIESDKAFIVMQRSGFGVMEAPYEDVGVVFETNDKDEAEKKAKELFHANNTPKAIESTWCENTYWVITNTKTEVGKQLLDDFKRESERIVREAKESGNYHEYGPEGHKIGVIGPKDNMFSLDIDNKGYDYKNAGIMFPIGFDKRVGASLIQRRDPALKIRKFHV
jgi:hypothetical protein